MCCGHSHATRALRVVLWLAAVCVMQVIGNVTLGQHASIWYGAILRGEQQSTRRTAVHGKLGSKPNPTGWNQHKAVLQNPTCRISIADSSDHATAASSITLPVTSTAARSVTLVVMLLSVTSSR